MQYWTLSEGIWTPIGASPFPSSDRQILSRAKKNPNLGELVHIKHMTERYVEQPRKLAKTYWMFYLPDFTRIFRDWYMWYIAEMLRVYGVKAHAEMEWDGTYLTLRYVGKRPITLVTEWLNNHEYDKLHALYEHIDQAERTAHKSLYACAHGTLTQTKLRECVQSVTAYATYGLNNVFPEELFETTFPQARIAALFTTNNSAWGALWKHAIDALEYHYVHHTPMSWTISAFAREHAHLRWGDIISREDDITFSTKILRDASVTYPSRTDILRERICEYERRRALCSRSTNHAELRALRQTIPRHQRALFDIYAEFGARSQYYNEERRIVFTRCLKLIRQYCEGGKMNWRTAPLSAVLNSVMRQQRR